MSVECVVKKPKLSDEERAARNNASKKSWAAKHCEQRRAYQLVYARCQRQAQLDAGFVPNSVGRPKQSQNRSDATIAEKVCVCIGREEMLTENIKKFTKGDSEPAGGLKVGFRPRAGLFHRGAAKSSRLVRPTRKNRST